MKKLLFVYPEMLIGGSTTSLIGLLETIVANGEYEVDLLLYTNTGPLLHHVPKGVHLLPQAFTGTNNNDSKYKKIMVTLFNGNYFKWFYCLCKYRKSKKCTPRFRMSILSVPAQVYLSKKIEQEYDVAIGFLELWADAYVASNKVNAKKKIGWIHPDYYEAGFFKEGDYEYLSKLDSLVFVSETTKKNFDVLYPELMEHTSYLRNILPKKIVLDKAIEHIDFVREQNCFYFVTVSRIVYGTKGLDRVVSAFTQFKDYSWFQDVRWVIVGDGPDMQRLKQDISQNGLEKHVILLGAQENPYPYIKLMDAFLLTSRYEGKPMSVDEAMLLGVPCCVTRYSAAEEQIGNKGIIWNNKTDSITEGLRDVIQNRTYIFEMKDRLAQFECGTNSEYAAFCSMIEK